MTNGRLVIEFFPGGAVAPATKEFDAVDAGIVEVAYTGMHYNMDKFSAGGLYNIIVAGPTPLEYLTWYLEGGGEELFQEMVKDYNVVGVSVAQITRAEMFGFSNKPLNTLEDFKGLKFRTAGDWGEILEKYFGASVIFLPGGEVYEAFQRGVIDAFEYGSPSLNWPMGFHEVAKYGVFPGIHAPSVIAPYIVNKDAWAKLPDDLKPIVEEEWLAEATRFLCESTIEDMAVIQKYKDYGLEFLTLTEDVQKEVEVAARDFYETKAAEDAFFAKVWTSVRDFMDSYRETDNLQFPYYK
jgi:TRAP-type mannitol/chloroaromatic compound transport system substrate-binding protein